MLTSKMDVGVAFGVFPAFSQLSTINDMVHCHYARRSLKIVHSSELYRFTYNHETPLTPLDLLAERATLSRACRRDRWRSRWTYAQFLDRCDRWSAVFAKTWNRPGDRVAYLSPNTHTQLESFYAVPQIGLCCAVKLSPNGR